MNKCLEDVLNILGSKKPFYKDCCFDENGHCYHALTKSGKKAYYKLEDILTALCLMGVIDNDVYLIMDLLDQIIELEI